MPAQMDVCAFSVCSDMGTVPVSAGMHVFVHILLVEMVIWYVAPE